MGAEQNRVVNVSLMVAPRTQTEIPVSCVEAGRWHATSRTFQAADRAHLARARAQKMQQVSRSLHLSEEPTSDQGAVWNAIAAKSSRMGVASATGAMSAIFEDRQEDVQDFLPMHSGPSMARSERRMHSGGTISGIDVFAAPTTFQKLACKLLASYALDALEASGIADPPSADALRSFIDAAKAARGERFSAPGMGETVRFSGDGLDGAALEVADVCMHVAAFRRGDDQSADLHKREPALQRSSVRGRHL